MRPPVPILRSFDEGKARELWVDFLGFTVVFETSASRPSGRASPGPDGARLVGPEVEPGLPLYLALRRGGCVVHVSEHRGDAAPGSSLRVEVDDVDALQAELLAKGHGYTRPVHDQPCRGTRDMTIHDPFGSRITFYTPLKRS